MTSPSTIVLTSTHDALLQQLAEARAERTGMTVERARRQIEVDALRIGIDAVQTADGKQAIERDQRTLGEHVKSLLRSAGVSETPHAVDVQVVYSPDPARQAECEVLRQQVCELLQNAPENMSLWALGSELIRAGSIVVYEEHGAAKMRETLALAAEEASQS